jgi:hypothetical protein
VHVVARNTAQSLPKPEALCATHEIQDAALDEPAKEVAPHDKTELNPPALEQVSFAGGFTDEQFEEMVRSMKADGIYPQSPQDIFQDASLDGVH